MSIGQPFLVIRYGGRDKGKKNSWVINDDAAKVVVDVFEEYVKDGATLKSTALAITAKYAYMDAPDSVMDIAKDKYYKTLTKCEE